MWPPLGYRAGVETLVGRCSFQTKSSKGTQAEDQTGRCIDNGRGPNALDQHKMTNRRARMQQVFEMALGPKMQTMQDPVRQGGSGLRVSMTPLTDGQTKDG